MEVKKSEGIPGVRLQQQVWVWIPLLHLPSPSTFLPSLLSCFAVSLQGHTLDSLEKKKKKRKSRTKYYGRQTVVTVGPLVLGKSIDPKLLCNINKSYLCSF